MATHSQSSPFHAGELAVQERLGVRQEIEPWARKFVRPYMPEQHRKFYSQLPFVVAASKDARNKPWITLLEGKPGFISSSDTKTLSIGAQLLPGDALENDLIAGSELGLLGIELETKRRNRVNGTLSAATSNSLEFVVTQSFGNCPQYITPRTWTRVDTETSEGHSTRHRALNNSMIKWIGSADTFFIGSGHKNDNTPEASGMDASHRGGPSGFVKVESPTRLVFPDYSGNNFFNTIGNLVADPAVALLFVDFETGSLLQLTGMATIDWDSPRRQNHAGAQRLISVDIDEIVELSNRLSLRFALPTDSEQSLKLVEKRRESNDVTSFYFASNSTARLHTFKAGQHLPIEISVNERQPAVTRTYSLSNSPGENRYRISVKREKSGLISRYLHDNLSLGSVITSKRPTGEFVVNDLKKPIVLIGGGIGATPLISMLHELTATPSRRPITFLHATRNSQHHVFAQEVKRLAETNDNLTVKTMYSRPLAADKSSCNFDFEGRLTPQVIERAINTADANFYVCGSAPFLATLIRALNAIGVYDDQIRFETF